MPCWKGTSYERGAGTSALFLEIEDSELNVTARLREIRRLSDDAVVYSSEVPESEAHGAFLSQVRDFTLVFSHEPLRHVMAAEETTDGVHYSVTAYYTDYEITFCFTIGQIK